MTILSFGFLKHSKNTLETLVHTFSNSVRHIVTAMGHFSISPTVPSSSGNFCLIKEVAIT